MSDNVVNLEPELHDATLRALVRLVLQDLLPHLLPPHGVVGAAEHGMPGAVPYGANRAARLGAVAHGAIHARHAWACKYLSHLHIHGPDW